MMDSAFGGMGILQLSADFFALAFTSERKACVFLTLHNSQYAEDT
jgi:hypothetical protein